MARKDFGEGLNALFGGSGEPQQPTDGATPTEANEEPTAATEEAKEDIISTVEDEALREALKKKRMQNRGRPRKNARHYSVTDGYQRVCVIMNSDKMEKVREMAFRETLTIKEVMEAALDLAIERYEATHGEIRPNKAARTGDVTKLFK